MHPRPRNAFGGEWKLRAVLLWSFMSGGCHGQRSTSMVSRCKRSKTLAGRARAHRERPAGRGTSAVRPAEESHDPAGPTAMFKLSDAESVAYTPSLLMAWRVRYLL